LYFRLCLGAWSDHGERTGGFYACNRYDSAKKEGVVCLLIMHFIEIFFKKFYYDYYIIYATAAAVGLSVSVLLLENSSSSYLGCCYGFLWF